MKGYENMSYEESVKKVENIISELSEKDISLDKAVNSFKEGIDELNKCRKALNEAKLVIKDMGENDDE